MRCWVGLLTIWFHVCSRLHDPFPSIHHPPSVIGYCVVAKRSKIYLSTTFTQLRVPSSPPVTERKRRTTIEYVTIKLYCGLTSYLPCEITDIRCCVIVTCLIWVKCSVPVSWMPAKSRKLSPSCEKTGCGCMSNHSFSGARSWWVCLCVSPTAQVIVVLNPSTDGWEGWKITWLSSFHWTGENSLATHTSAQIQSGGKHTEMMLMFCDRDIHTTDTCCESKAESADVK